MAAIIFPLTLPDPSVSVVTPAERRLLSDVTGGPQQARGMQRDYLATQRVEWDVLSPEEATAFDVWWTTTLTKGGAWFASTWPAPQGWVSIARRFIGAPRWQHLAGGFWRVSAQVLVRGRGTPPQTSNGPIYWGGAGSAAPPWVLVDKIATLDAPPPNDSGDSRYIYGTRAIGSGKVYFELASVDTSSSATHPGDIGFCSVDHSQSWGCGDVSGGWSATKDGVGFVSPGEPGDNIPSFLDYRWENRVTGFAIDFSLGLAWISTTGHWTTRDPDTGLHPLFTDVTVPILIMGNNQYSTPHTALTMHTTTAEMVYTIPAGFTAIEEA